MNPSSPTCQCTAIPSGNAYVRIFAFFVLVCSFSATADIAVGIDAGYSFTSSFTEPYSSSTKSYETTFNNVELTPYITLYKGNHLEVSPFIGWKLYSSDNEYRYPNSDSTDDGTTVQQSLTLGCRLLYRLVNNRRYAVLIGPELGYQYNFPRSAYGSVSPVEPSYSSYYYGAPWFGIPVNVDLHCTETFSLRFSWKLLYCSYAVKRLRIDGKDTDDYYRYIVVNFKNVISPVVGCYVNF